MFNLETNIIKLIPGILLVLTTVNCFRLDDSEEPDSAVFGDDDEIKGEGIVGGRIADVKTFPYFAQIRDFGRQMCGAAIISEYWVITAAHCLHQIYSDTHFNHWVDIVVGTNFREEGGKVYQVNKNISHENYTLYPTIDNDIALIQVDKKIVFSDVQQPIPISKIHPRPGHFIEVAGFGTTGEKQPSSSILKSAVLPVVNRTECEEKNIKVMPFLQEAVTRNMFCAGVGGDETCQGDSGGPAVINGKLVGIISWGYDCGSSGVPGVYTLVKKYRGWIAKHTGLNL